MTDHPSPDDANLNLFCEMAQAIPNLYLWSYSPHKALLRSGCPGEHRAVLESLFFRSGFFEKILSYSREHDAPYALGAYMGLVWFAVLEKKGESLSRIHLMGPVFHAPVQENQLESFLKEYEQEGMPFYARHALMKILLSLPVIFQKYFGQLALMLHYCVNGEHLSYGDLQFLVDRQLDETQATAPALYRDIRLRNLRLMKQIRMGDLSDLTRSPQQDPQQGTSYGMLPTNAANIRTPLRTLKDSAVIFTAQCADAAIDGGLSPEMAYAMADRYMGSMEQNRSSPELMAMMSSMYRDYLQSVHRARRQSSLSPEVRSCMDYIDLHPWEALEIAQLADMVGYSTYYLSRKFRRETGQSLRDYIKERKVRQGALLLTTTQDDLGTIAERLGFCSRSHFSDTFHKIMGMSPSEYRKDTPHG